MCFMYLTRYSDHDILNEILLYSLEFTDRFTTVKNRATDSPINCRRTDPHY